MNWWIKELHLEELNPGIRKTVAYLRSLGFDTVDSGDGQTHEHECDRPHGYVTISLQKWQRLEFCVEAVCAALEARGAEIDTMDGVIVDGLYKRGDGIDRCGLPTGKTMIDVNCIADDKLDWDVYVNPDVIQLIAKTGRSLRNAEALCAPGAPALDRMLLHCRRPTTHVVDCKTDDELEAYRANLDVQACLRGMRVKWTRRRGRMKLWERVYGTHGPWSRAGIIVFRGPEELGKASKA